MGFHEIEELGEPFLEFGPGLGVVFKLPVVFLRNRVVDLLNQRLP